MSEKIVIIDDDLDTLRLVGLMLQKQGYQIAAANNGAQGLLKAAEEDPDLILLDVMMPDMDGYEVARRLRDNPETANIPILMFTAKSQLDDKVTGFEAGVDDYLTKPTHPTELKAHVKALLARSVKPKKEEGESSINGDAFTIGIISARGGLGVSAVSINLGSFLNTSVGKETIVMELTSGLGTLGRDLGFSDSKGFSSLLEGSPEDITKEKVEESLHEHESGLRVLLASEEPKDMVLNNAIAQTKTIVNELSSLTHFLVIDFGAGLSSLNQNILPQCDQIVVVVEAYSNSISHTKLLLENLFELGIEEKQILVLLNNRMRSEMLLSLGKVREEFNYRVDVSITPAPEIYAQATRLNTTAILHAPESMLTQQFKTLAELITESKAEGK